MRFVFTLFFIPMLLAASRSQEQELYKPLHNKVTLKKLIKEAKRADEIDKQAVGRLFEIHKDLREGSEDANHIYNYGRSLQKALQPSFAEDRHEFTSAAIKLMLEAELAYRYAVTYCECHGRANVMLGMLYNQQRKYNISAPYLKKGLQLEEGSDDWMIAANQYLLAGAYTSKTKETDYQRVYHLFKKYAPQNSNRYYKKMAGMYVPYYED